MTPTQAILATIIVCALLLFGWGRWRYDMVAMAALLAAVLLGVIGLGDAFSGFASPVVITVAAVLAIGRVLERSGLVDIVGRRLAGSAGGQFGQMAALCLFGAILSGVMNNVGVLAVLIPVAVNAAHASGYSVSRILMPLCFATLLGGTMTQIGTSPNLLVADFRAQAFGERFGLFDFLPVGIAVMLAGVAFIVLVGWRLIPKDRAARTSEGTGFEIARYVTEVRVGEQAAVLDKTVREFERETENAVTVIGLIRDEQRMIGRLLYERIRPGDILLVQSDSDTLQRLVRERGLELEEQVEIPTDDQEKKNSFREFVIVEAVVMPTAWIRGRTASSLRLRRHWEINLLALSRQGRPVSGRLRDVPLAAGDVLLLEGDEGHLNEIVTSLGCLPLADRKLTFEPRRFVVPLAALGAAILASALGLTSIAIAFAAAVVALVIAGALRPREVYDAIDWPVIILIGAMIPLGRALADTGVAPLIAGSLTSVAGEAGPFAVFGAVLAAATAMTRIVNNVAAAAILAPIAIGIANALDVSADPFLMAVAVGASCAFLTPGGHQNNTIILGPGGYRSGDYLILGGPLTLFVMAVALFVIPIVWPF